MPLPNSVLDSLQKSLSAFLSSPANSSTLLLFHGSPGTGKTSTAFALATALHVPHEFVAAASLLRSTEEETHTEINSCFSTAQSKSPCVLVLDDLDALCRPRSALREPLERYAVTALLRALDLPRARTVLVLATARDTTGMDPEVVSRFTPVFFPLPSPSERARILRCLTERLAVPASLLDDVAAESHGFVGADLTAIVRYAATQALLANRLPMLTAADFTAARKVLQPSLLQQHAAFASSQSLANVVGLDAVVSALKVSVVMPFRDPQVLRAIGITRTSGVLLYGPPGCGKTLVARAAASDARVNVIEVQGAEILTKLVGESEKAIARLFARAQQVAPSILLFDQFEFLGRARTSETASSHTAERIVSCLLTELDNIRRTQAEVLVLATAASREVLDASLLQPGRLEQQICVPLPSAPQRCSILRQRFQALPLSSETVQNEAWLARLVDHTAGFSSAALQLLCEEAALVALREDIATARVTERHFEQALQRKKYH